MKKQAAALILCAILVISLSACKNGNSEGEITAAKPVMTLGEYTIDEGVYRFLYATYKARYLSMYSDASDTSAFWNAEFSDGVTNAARFDDLVRDNIRMYLVAEKLFDDEGLSISDSALAEIDDYIDELVSERFDGDRGKLEASLVGYGADADAFREVTVTSEKMTRLFDHYFASNGTRALTDDDRSAYYTEHYVRFAQINVNDAYAYVESDGAYVQNEDGTYKTRDLTDAERAKKDAIISEIDDALAAGESVESLYSDYSENTDYPDGYYFSRESAVSYDEKLVDTAFSLAVGEYAKLRTEHGTFWIERLELPKDGWALTGSADFFGDLDDAVKNELFDELLKSHFSEIVEDAEAVDSVSVKNLKPNYDLY